MPPAPGQDMAVIRDRDGGACGFWLRQSPTEIDRELIPFLMIRFNVPPDVQVNVIAGNYRVVPNTHDDAGGAFVMFGNALAPGEDSRKAAGPKKTGCLVVLVAVGIAARGLAWCLT